MSSTVPYMLTLKVLACQCPCLQHALGKLGRDCRICRALHLKHSVTGMDQRYCDGAEAALVIFTTSSRRESSRLSTIHLKASCQVSGQATIAELRQDC